MATDSVVLKYPSSWFLRVKLGMETNSIAGDIPLSHWLSPLYNIYIYIICIMQILRNVIYYILLYTIYIYIHLHTVYLHDIPMPSAPPKPVASRPWAAQSSRVVAAAGCPPIGAWDFEAVQQWKDMAKMARLGDQHLHYDIGGSINGRYP